MHTVETPQNRGIDQLWSPAPVEMTTVFRIIWYRKWLLIFCLMASTGAANWILAEMPKRYTATAEVMLNNRETHIVDIENVVSDLAGLDDSANEQRVLSSEKLLSRLIDRLRLDKDPEFNPVLREPDLWREWYSSLNAALADGYLAPVFASRLVVHDASLEDSRQRLMVITNLRKALVVKGVPYTRAMEVQFTSTVPAKAALIANVMADLYIVDQLEEKFEATRRASAWLSDRISQLKAKVHTSEAAVELFKGEQAIGSRQGAGLTDQQIAELNTELITARAARAEAAARFQQVQRRIDKGGLNAASRVVSSPLILTLRTQLADLRREEAELGTRYGEKHPRIINVRAEIKDANAGISAEVRKFVEGLKNDVAVARARENTLQQSLTTLEDKSVQLSRNSVQLRQLEREAQADRLIYETFLNRFRETSEQEDLQAADARLLTAATPPLKPTAPNRKKILVIATALGTILGLGLVWLFESTTKTFRAVSDVARFTGLSVLAALPRWRRRRTRRQVLNYISQRPNSVLAETIRTMRSALFLSQIDAPPQVLMVTSSGPGEGKSTTCTLLAKMATMAGQRVVIVECDIRRPTMKETFQFQTRSGLLQVLDGTIPLDEAVETDLATNISVLAVAEPFPQAADVFSSDRFSKMISSLRAKFDLILLDTPPAMLVPDAGVIGKTADAAIYAVRYDHTPRQAVIEGLASLQGLGVRVAGCVVTMVNRRHEAKYASAAHGAGYAEYSGNKLYYAD